MNQSMPHALWGAMSMARRFLWRHRHILFLVPFLASIGVFFLLERAIPVPRFYIETAFDSSIPFLPAFVIPYVIWYGYVILPFVVLYFTDRRDFCRYCLYLATGMFVACGIFLLFPNGQSLRPHVLPNTFCGQILGNIYAADTATNSLPSLHVVETLGAHFAICRFASRRGRRHHPVVFLSCALAVIISMSTVFVKQHSLLDVVAGVALSAVLYCVFYLRGWLHGVYHPLRSRITAAVGNRSVTMAGRRS